MSDIIVVTNRSICSENFLLHIENLVEAHPEAIILREKDLPESEYEILAQSVLDICDRHGVLCILHNFVHTAKKLNATGLHLPVHILRGLSTEERKLFKVLGASCHSVDEALEAEHLGCTYITAGHVFDTDCKKGLPGRGIEFLQEVCDSISIPAYAIGGINSENYNEVKKVGVAGVCVMSGAMTCNNANEYLKAFRENKNEV